MALLELNQVEYTYPANRESLPLLAIKDIKLNIEREEFVCLLGPSGCGKSTLLKIIAGYFKPSKGTACLEGKEIEGADRHRGVVFQSPTLYPWLNVRENIEFGLRMRGIDPQERNKVSSQYLEQIEMTKFAQRKTFELSGGMKQRVSLARVLAGDPDMILMDEPFGALDALTRLKMQSMMRKLWKTNKSTVFMITHDIDEALSLATRIIIMSPFPGTLVKEFKLDFTRQATKSENGRVKINQEYIDLKEQILDLVI